MSQRLHILIEPGALAKYFAPDCLRKLEEHYQVTRESAGGLDEAAVSERLRGVEAVMTGWGAPGLTPANLQAADALKLVAHFGGSCSMISTEVGIPLGITYVNCAAGMVDAMAEATVGMMLAVGYQFPTTDRRLRQEADFSHHYPLSYGLTGKRVGIFGLGHIGRRVAEVLAAFRTTLLGYDPFAAPDVFERLGVERVDSLSALLAGSEILTVHAGWTKETTGIVSRELLARLPDGALVVNNARLPIIDEEALLDEVKAGRLRAALNIIPARPELYGRPELATLDGLLYTSGAANVSDVYARGMSETLTDDLLRYARGETPRQVVTREWVERTT